MVGPPVLVQQPCWVDTRGLVVAAGSWQLLHMKALSAGTEEHLKGVLVSALEPVLTLGVLLRCRAQRNCLPWQRRTCLNSS